MIITAGLSPAWQEVLLFDDLRPGEVNRAREVHRCAAGKSVNAARAIHRLASAGGAGAGARALTILGGWVGDAMVRALAEEGVGVAFVRSGTLTRICVTVINSADGSITELVENAGPAAPGELEEFRDLFRQEARGAEAAVILGSLPEGAPPDYYRTLLEGISAPAVIDARGPELLEVLKLRPFLVKPNREELAKTVGRPIRDEGDLRLSMLELERRGARWVLVSQGRNVLWALGEGTFYRFQPPLVDTVNPIGSGDCMAGGIAYAAARGADPVEAIRLGIACAAENASVILPGHIDPSRVESLRSSIRVELV